MKPRGMKKIVVGLAASATMVGGLALAAPAMASAAPPPPWTGVSQNGNNVTVDMHGPGNTPCAATAIELTKAAEVVADPQQIMNGGAGVTPIVGTAPWPANNPNSGTVTLPSGIYVIAASCADLGGISRPTLQPILVPNGIEGVVALLDYGNNLLQNPQELDNLVGAIELFF